MDLTKFITNKIIFVYLLLKNYFHPKCQLYATLLNSHTGQSLLEFVMLLCVMILFSFALLKGMNSAIADQWIAMVKVITYPSSSAIKFR